MAVNARQRIDEIRRISDDQVEVAVNIGEQIAFDDRNIANSVNRGIDSAEPKRPPIDVTQSNNTSPSCRHEGGYLQACRAAAGADIKNSQPTRGPLFHRAPGLLDKTHEAVRVRSKEDRVRLLGGKGGMHEQLSTQGRETDRTSVGSADELQCAGLG